MFALTLALALTLTAASPAYKAAHKPYSNTYAQDTRWQGGPLYRAPAAPRGRTVVVPVMVPALAPQVGMPTAQGMADAFARQMLEAEPGQAMPAAIRVNGETCLVTVVE